MTQSDKSQPTPPLHYAGLFKRLFALLYDSFLVIAILFIVTGIANTLNHGVAIEPGNRYHLLYLFVIVSLSYLYFAWFWIHGGQTLGMKTWQIIMLSDDERTISWRTTATRSISAIISMGFFGLGFLWSFIDKKKRCWHDIVCKTVVLDLRKH